MNTLGGVYNYNSYILVSQLKRKRLMSETFSVIILAFFIVVISAFVLNFIHNYFSFLLLERSANQYQKGIIIETAERNKDRLLKLFGIKTVYAATLSYQAEILSNYCRIINIVPGRAITCQVSFKNVGNKTWYNFGSNYISLYADNLGKIFRHKYWYSAEQPAKLQETKVLPGQVGHLRFALQAPEISGFYKVKFKLAAENLTWISGGVLEIPINISLNDFSSSNLANSASPTTVSESISVADFQALKLIQSHNSTINLNSGEKVIFMVGFKNTGAKSWETSGQNAVKICVASNSLVDAFRDVSWVEANCPAMVSSLTLPGQVGYFNFNLRGNLNGDYNQGLFLMNGDKLISGSEMVLPIKISGSVSVPIISPETLASEPLIRIGLYSTTKPVALQASTSFEVRDSENNLIFIVPSGTIVYASYNFQTKQYAVTLNNEIRDNLSYLKFIAPNLNTIFEIVNYENRPNWNTSLNDNKFRGNLELRYSEGREKLYVINELPMETYLKGLAESSNNNPIEYHKALAIAARTYAQYNINIGGKHPAGYFHLNASAYDQVYRGYNSELRLPNFVRAVEETRGMMVTYNNEIVVTPYFSQSDGRTRAWEEVWSGGPKPWLVSRPDPYCAKMSLWGHGVGFSARGAHGMARAGSNFEQILKHYYTGIELKKIY